MHSLVVYVYASLPGSFCYLDPSSLSKSNKLFKNLLKVLLEKHKIIIPYVVNKATAESRHTNGSEIPRECLSQLKASSQKKIMWAGILTLRSLQKRKYKNKINVIPMRFCDLPDKLSFFMFSLADLSVHTRTFMGVLFPLLNTCAFSSICACTSRAKGILEKIKYH